MSALTVLNLTKQYSNNDIAVNNISFELKKNETLGTLRANGAGKTTTIAILLGRTTPSQGSILYFGNVCRTFCIFFAHLLRIKNIMYSWDDWIRTCSCQRCFLFKRGIVSMGTILYSKPPTISSSFCQYYQISASPYKNTLTSYCYLNFFYFILTFYVFCSNVSTWACTFN